MELALDRDRVVNYLEYKGLQELLEMLDRSEDIRFHSWVLDHIFDRCYREGVCYRCAVDGFGLITLEPRGKEWIICPECGWRLPIKH